MGTALPPTASYYHALLVWATGWKSLRGEAVATLAWTSRPLRGPLRASSANLSTVAQRLKEHDDKPLTTPELKPLNLAVLATASFTETDRRTQAANIGRLAKGVAGVRVVTYAINAIDNNVAGWTSSGWTQMAE